MSTATKRTVKSATSKKALIKTTERSKMLLELKKIQAAMEIETRHLDKKQHSDLIWIGRLQRTLSAKVLG